MEPLDLRREGIRTLVYQSKTDVPNQHLKPLGHSSVSLSEEKESNLVPSSENKGTRIILYL